MENTFLALNLLIIIISFNLNYNVDFEFLITHLVSFAFSAT